MSTTIRLPDSTDTKLTEYCKAHGITKSEAVRRALDSFLNTMSKPTPYELGKDGFGADKTHSGDIARHSKKALQDQSILATRWRRFFETTEPFPEDFLLSRGDNPPQDRKWFHDVDA